MNEQEKAAFLFTYLEEFKRLGRHFNTSESDATVLYFNRIELFKMQLQQQDITREIGNKMFYDLSISVLGHNYYEIRKGRRWQIKLTNVRKPDEPSEEQPV